MKLLDTKYSLMRKMGFSHQLSYDKPCKRKKKKINIHLPLLSLKGKRKTVLISSRYISKLATCITFGKVKRKKFSCTMTQNIESYLSISGVKKMKGGKSPCGFVCIVHIKRPQPKPLPSTPFRPPSITAFLDSFHV